MFKAQYWVNSDNNYESFVTVEEAEEFARTEALDTKTNVQILRHIATVEYLVTTPITRNGKAK
jgi:hypothetical protein